jgi:hypothetical protein
MSFSISARTSRSSASLHGDSSARTGRLAGEAARFAGDFFAGDLFAAVLVADAALGAGADFFAGADFVAAGVFAGADFFAGADVFVADVFAGADFLAGAGFFVADAFAGADVFVADAFAGADFFVADAFAGADVFVADVLAGADFFAGADSLAADAFAGADFFAGADVAEGVPVPPVGAEGVRRPTAPSAVSTVLAAVCRTADSVRLTTMGAHFRVGWTGRSPFGGGEDTDRAAHPQRTKRLAGREFSHARRGARDRSRAPRREVVQPWCSGCGSAACSASASGPSPATFLRSSSCPAM